MLPPSITYGILSFNRRDQLRALLAQLDATKVSGSEIVVVDNGSIDGTVEMLNLAKSSDTKIVLNKENTGVAKGWNTIFKNSSGKLVFIFNDDYSIANAGWEQLYLDTFEKGPAVMSFPRSWGTPGAEPYTNWIVERGGRYSHNFRLFGIPREIWDRIGGFDEEYMYAYEDTAFNMTAFKLGYPLLEMNTAKVHIDHLKETKAVKGTYEAEKERIHMANFGRNSTRFYGHFPKGV